MPSVIQHKIYIFQEKYKLGRVILQSFTKYTSAEPSFFFFFLNNMFIYNSSFSEIYFVLNMCACMFYYIIMVATGRRAWHLLVAR